MAFSFTGLAYLSTFFSAGFLTYRFFQYWRREKTIVAAFFFYFMAVFCLFFLVTTIPSLFFAKNTFALKGVVISTAFLEGLAAAFLGYLIVYLKLPKISPWIGFSLPLLLGTIATILSIIIPFEPFLEADGVINWGSQGLAYIFRNLVYLITFLPITIILINQLRRTKNPYERARALGLLLVFSVVMIITLFDYGVEKMLSLKAVSSDIVQIILSIFMFAFLFLTQKLPPLEKKYIPPPLSPKIPW